MIGTIIVDDDVEVLQGLKGFIRWEECGFRVLGTAADGRSALALVRKTRPGLLIADITMPVMDGLALIRESQRICPGLKSILLTCHEDFAYAQEAISLGVMDYLLKIALTPEMLTRSLERVRCAVSRETDAAEPLPRVNEGQAGSSVIVQSDLLVSLIEAGPEGAGVLLDAAVSRGIGFPGTAYRAFTFFLDDPGAPAGAVLATIRDACGSRRDTSLFPLGEAASVLLAWYQKEPFGIPQDLMTGVRIALRRIRERHGQAASCCISGASRDIKDLGRCIEECRSLREAYFYAGSGLVITERASWTSSTAPLTYEELSEELGSLLRSPDAGPAARFMERLAGLGSAADCSPSVVRGVLARLLVDIDTAANKRGFVLEHALAAAHTFAACLSLFRSVLEDYQARARTALPASTREEIASVLRYVHTHQGASMRCEEMAALVNLSPSYFSRLFKKEVGMSYTDYVLRQRVEHARDLLAHTRLSFEEITWAVGLENASYFHRAFKKVTGMTPRQAR